MFQRNHNVRVDHLRTFHPTRDCLQNIRALFLRIVGLDCHYLGRNFITDQIQIHCSGSLTIGDTENLQYAENSVTYR